MSPFTIWIVAVFIFHNNFSSLSLQMFFPFDDTFHECFKAQSKFMISDGM